MTSMGVDIELPFDERDLTGISFFIRAENIITGKHYHTGKNPNKDPEILFLLEGTAEFTWFDRGVEYNADTIHTSIIKGPTKITTKAMVWHQLRTITRCIFLELNSWDDAKEDTIQVDIDIDPMLKK